MLNENTFIKKIDGYIFKINNIESESSEQSSYTHYLHNYENVVSKFYKKDAVTFVKTILKENYPEQNITNKVAEEALQYLIFDLKNSVPFPAPNKPKFKF